MEDSRTSKYRRRLYELTQDSQTWRAHWNEIVDYILPRKGRYLTSTTGKETHGGKKGQKIINGCATEALKILSAGMYGGLTSPSRPWFVLNVEDEELASNASVREWLHNVRDIMLNVFAKSNFYGTMHSMYQELGAFGTAVMMIEEDFDRVIRCRPFTIGEFYLAVDDKYNVTTMYRRFQMTARNMVAEFGEDNVSDSVKQSVASEQGERKFDVIHAVEPNSEKEIGKDGAKGMEYVSVYYEEKGNTDSFLRESGYRTMPFAAPRWSVTAADTYGDSPGMDALGSVKMLQKMEEKKLKALDKMVDPPMNAPVAMKKTGGTIIAGGVNYIDTQQGQQGFVPAYQVNPDIQNIAFELDRVEKRIEKDFSNDLFLAVLGTDKKMTATEVNQRYEEKSRILGPVLEHVQSELLDVVINRTLDIMSRFNLLPPAPPELQNAVRKIEYISTFCAQSRI